MDDILKSIKAYLYDRTASPLLGAFIMAWSICNYRFFMIIFSSKKEFTTTKFGQIDTFFNSYNIPWGESTIPLTGLLFKGLLCPAIITFIYLYVYPILAKKVYQHSLKNQTELRSIKQDIENNRLLSVEESRELYKQLADLKSELERESENYTKQVSSLNQTIKDLEGQSADGPSGMNLADLKSPNIEDSRNSDFMDIEDEIYSEIESFDDREFQLSDLIAPETWSILSSSERQQIGKRLKKKVEQGDFEGVNASKKGSGNQQIYIKKSIENEKHSALSLPPKMEETLQLFEGLASNQRLTEQAISKRADKNIDLIRVMLDDLFQDDYLRMAQSRQGDNLYDLSPKGRKYLVENNLLQS